MKPAGLLVYAAAIISLAGGAARADRVYTHNGTWRGIILEETPVHILLEKADGSIITIPRSNIREIEYTAVEDAEQIFSEIQSLKRQAESAYEENYLKEALYSYRQIADMAGEIRERAGSYYNEALDIKNRAESKAAEILSRLEEQDVFIEDTAGPKDILAARGMDFNAGEFVKAAGRGGIEELSLFLEGGMDINALNEAGRTALMEACRQGSLEAVRHLLSAGAEVKIEDNADRTALHMAVENGNTDIISLIVERWHNG